MSGKSNIWHELAEYARWAPSPHNTQPARLKIINDREAQVYFVTNRGLDVGDPQGRFTFLTFGIFVEIIKIAAASKGYSLSSKYTDKPLYKTDEDMQKVADLILTKRDGIEDMDPQLILKRRTSRLSYNNKKIPEEVIEELKREVSRFSHTIEFRTDKNSIQKVVELNKDSLFFDLEHKDYREELRRWLRYSEKEADQKRDGLDMETMRIPGFLAKSFMYQYWIYTAPILKKISELIYIKTMKGIATVAWIQGPYRDQEDWIRAGHLMIRLWLIMTKHGVYWQPYGSVITNDKARKKLIESFGIQDEKEGENMVWFLLRMGYSDTPPRSRRLPLEEIIL